MKLETILQLLYTNNLQDIVSRAVQIDNNIPLPVKTGDTIPVDLQRNDLPDGKTFKSDAYGGTLFLNVEAVNPYSLDAPYLVTLPNGKTKWVKAADSGRLSEIVDREVPSLMAH